MSAPSPSRNISTESNIDWNDESRKPSWAYDDSERRTFSRKRSLECSAIEITISTTELNQNHTVYVINVSCGMRSWTIKRRYKDFDYLDRQLKKQFPSLSLPALPPKRYLRSSSDPEIVDERKQQLENYLNQLVCVQQIWARNDFVLFLNDDSNLMTFIWSFERMRRLQDMLRATQGDNQQEKTQLNKDLQFAEKQVKELQDKLSQMEMLFLQQAAGMAKDQLPNSIIRSISGVHNNKAHLAAQLHAELSREEQNSLYGDKSEVGMDLDELSLADADRQRRKSESSVNTSGGESVECGENSAYASRNTEVEAEEEIQPEDVMKAIHLVQQGISRPTTPDDRRVTAVTLQIQEALRLSEELTSAIDTRDLIFGHSSNSPPPVTMEKASPEKARDLSRFSPAKFPVSKGEEVLNKFISTTQVDQHNNWANLLVQQMAAIEDALFPSEASLQTRFDVFIFVRDLICRTLGVPLFPIGSSVSHTFLQDSDLNCTAFVSSKSPLVDDSWYVKVNEALCLSAFQQQAGNSTDFTTSPIVVSNVSFVNREMKMIRSIINGITVDITMNQYQSLFMETLIERVDAFVGKTHLFKRSLVLLKAWFQYESSKYTYGGDSLTNTNTAAGGASGLKYVQNNTAISTWSIVTMLIATFQQHGEDIFFPVQALGYCFRYLTGFDWMNSALTIFGPVSLTAVHEYKPISSAESNYLPASILAFPTIEDQLQVNKQFYTARLPHQNQQSSSEEEIVSEGDAAASELQNDLEIKDVEGELSATVHVAQSTALPAPVVPIYNGSILNVLDPLSHVVLEPITQSGNHHGHHPKRPYTNLFATMTHSTAENFLDALHSGYKHFQSLCDSCSKILSFGVFSSDSVRKEVSKFTKECFFNICHQHALTDEHFLPPNAASLSPNAKADLLLINAQDLEFSRSYSEMILGGRIDSELLSQLVVLILEKKGLMPVGEIGKNLQSLLGCDLLSKRLKEQFSGLKKAIEHANIRRLVVGTEHPFNPIVKLLDQEENEKESAQSVAGIPWSYDHLNYLFTAHQVALQLQGLTPGGVSSGQSVASNSSGYNRDNRDNYSVVSAVTMASSTRGSGGYGNANQYNYRQYRRPPPMVLDNTNNSQYGYRGGNRPPQHHFQQHHTMYSPGRMNPNSSIAMAGPPHPPNSPFYSHQLPPGAIPIPLELLPPGMPPGVSVAGSPVGMYSPYSPMFSSSPVQMPFIPPPHAFYPPPGPLPGYMNHPNNMNHHPNLSPDQHHSS